MEHQTCSKMAPPRLKHLHYHADTSILTILWRKQQQQHHIVLITLILVLIVIILLTLVVLIMLMLILRTNNTTHAAIVCGLVEAHPPTAQTAGIAWEARPCRIQILKT